ncbi:MAG: membrane protein insertase YidC [Clostridia bacterium]|nr:membrane protein insertase YidC [Clostridia bacterium]
MNIWDIINVPLGFIIKLSYQLTQNYALALFLFAVVLQLLLVPFGIKMQKNTVKQARLRPKEMAIRKKYAGRTDQATQQKLNNEIMDLYQRENFNPMGGCLPMLIQLPILFSLYNVVVSPLKYICGFGEDVIKAIQAKVYELMSAAEMTGFEAFAPEAKAREIDLITKMRELGLENFVDGNGEAISEELLPNFVVLGGMDLSQVPSFNNINLLLLIPLFTLIVTLGSSWIMKKFTYNPNPDAKPDASMRMMQWSMPLLSVYISFTIAAAIGLYWIFRNILSVVEKIILSKLYPIPQFTEEDYKAAEREANAKPLSKKQQKKKVRSLHRIDEDDDLPEAPAEKDGKPQLKSGVDADEAPKLKDDDRHNKDKNEETTGEDKAE